MPVSIVVGGQFGSEGKGKVALEIARGAVRSGAAAVVRVGGPNSGHTAFDLGGRKWALRQMPAASIDRNVDVIFPSGSYIDVPLLLNEINQLGYPLARVHISDSARVVVAAHRAWESEAGLEGTIGSTGSGVGAAVIAAVARGASNLGLPSISAQDVEALQPFIADTTSLLRQMLSQQARIIIEGTQGFGLSLLDGGYWPKATSRFTTAAGALAEAGLSPLDVDDVTVVLRSYPIRVAGDSGPLRNELTWEEIAERAGRDEDLREYTTVTRRLRRVGEFDAGMVRRALAANHPTRLVINHMDYIGGREELGLSQSQVETFLAKVERAIDRKVDAVGFDPRGLVQRQRAYQ